MYTDESSIIVAVITKTQVTDISIVTQEMNVVHDLCPVSACFKKPRVKVQIETRANVGAYNLWRIIRDNSILLTLTVGTRFIHVVDTRTSHRSGAQPYTCFEGHADAQRGPTLVYGLSIATDCIDFAFGVRPRDLLAMVISRIWRLYLSNPSLERATNNDIVSGTKVVACQWASSRGGCCRKLTIVGHLLPWASYEMMLATVSSIPNSKHHYAIMLRVGPVLSRCSVVPEENPECVARINRRPACFGAKGNGN